MALTTDIVATYRGPGRVFAALAARGRREDMALTYALLAGAMMFVAALPWQSRAAFLDASVPLEARLYWSAMLFVFLLPLGLFALTMVAGVLLRVLRAGVSGYALRISLFWTLVALTPLTLLAGLVAGFIGEGVALQAVGLIWVAIFVWFLMAGLRSPAWRL